MRSRTIATLGLLVAFLSGILVSGLVLPAPAWAQAAKPEFKLKLMGINRALDPWKLYDEWARTVEQRTNGRVQFEMTSLPELGFGGAETIRVLKTGVIDVAEASSANSASSAACPRSSASHRAPE